MKPILLTAVAVAVSAGLVAAAVWGTCQMPVAASAGHCEPQGDDAMPVGQCCFVSTAEVKVAGAFEPQAVAMDFPASIPGTELYGPQLEPEAIAAGPPGSTVEPLQMICVLRI